MRRTSSATQHVRPLAEAVGVSVEATDLALDMTRVATRSPSMVDRLPKAIAAGSLYTASLAVGFERGSRSGRGGDCTTTTTAAPHRARPRSPNSAHGLKRNTQIGHRRTDHRSTEMTICQFASITPPSLRRYAREVAAIYLADDENGSQNARARLARLPLR